MSRGRRSPCAGRAAGRKGLAGKWHWRGALARRRLEERASAGSGGRARRRAPGRCRRGCGRFRRAATKIENRDAELSRN